MWIAILVVVTIIGAVIGFLIFQDDEGCFWLTLLFAAFFFVVCMGIKLGVTDKSFVCTDVSFEEGRIIYESDQKQLYKTKVEVLGSKMILDFFDKSVKCTSIYKQKEEEKTFSFVLDEVSGWEPNEPHIYQTESMVMEMYEWAFFITSFTINDGKGQILTFKREYF